MPPSLFDNLATSLQETERFISGQRAGFARLRSRYDTFTSVASNRNSRLNYLVRLTTDLIAKKDACRHRIEEEQRKLRDHEAARAEIAQELEGLRLQLEEAEDVRREMVVLQDEIVALDDELQQFKMLARKIQRRARERSHAASWPTTTVVETNEMIGAASRAGRVRPAMGCITVMAYEREDTSVTLGSSSLEPALASPRPARKVNFVVAVPVKRPVSGDALHRPEEDVKRPRLLRRCALTPSIEAD